ncbi:MAG: ROK family protein [Gemmatimonadales bacterium]
MRYIVGVDVGGTNTVVATLPEDGSQVYGVYKEPTLGRNGPDGVVEQIARMIDASRREASDAAGEALEVVGVGIGAPGPLDTKTGVVLLTPNLGWRNFPLRDRVSEAVGLPATLDNDANCAVFGEWWRGAAQGTSLAIGLTIGTGIGGGVVLDGKIFHGSRDIAAEFGHMSIDSTGRRCKCGNYGCLEAYASGTAIASRAVEGIEAGAPSSLPDYVERNLDAVTAYTVYQAAQDGDEYAREVLKDTARFLGTGVANLINIFNPEVVVILGGVTQAGEELFRPLRAEVARRAFRPAVEGLRIVPGTLPGRAGVYGAVAAFKAQQWGAV